MHEAGNTMFYVPGTIIPDWFEQHSSGGLISFWFRNKFPAISLCVVTPSMFIESSVYPIVIINGNRRLLDPFNDPQIWMQPDHTYIFDLQKIRFKDNWDEALLENEWNHVEISFSDKNMIPVLLESGIHVFKQKISSMEDIKFTNSCRKRKLDDDLDQ